MTSEEVILATEEVFSELTIPGKDTHLPYLLSIAVYRTKVELQTYRSNEIHPGSSVRIIRPIKRYLGARGYAPESTFINKIIVCPASNAYADFAEVNSEDLELVEN